MNNIIIPPGYRFLPTDQELILCFLLRKAMGQPLPWNPILEKNLYGDNANPWDIFGDVDDSQWDVSDSRQEKEFKIVKKVIFVFTRLSKINGKSRIARRAGCGRWDGQTGGIEILMKGSGEVIGVKKMLTFKADKGISGYEDRKRDHWNMHEYSLSNVTMNCGLKYMNYVVCKITRTSKEKYVRQPIPRGLGCSENMQLLHENDQFVRKRSRTESGEVQEYACLKKQKADSSSDQLEGNSMPVLAARTEPDHDIYNDDNYYAMMLESSLLSEPSLDSLDKPSMG